MVFSVLDVECFRLDAHSLRAWVNDQDVGLTEVEFKLLVLLLEANGELRSTEELAAELGQSDSSAPHLTPQPDSDLSFNIDRYAQSLKEKLLDAAPLLEKSHLGYRICLNFSEVSTTSLKSIDSEHVENPQSRSEPSKKLVLCRKCMAEFDGSMIRCPNDACASMKPFQGWTVPLVVGDIFDQRYQIISRLAKSETAITYLVKSSDQDTDLLALKVLYKSLDTRVAQRLSIEAYLLQLLRHSNIVDCLGVVQMRGNPPYLVTRFAEGGSLLQTLQRFRSLSMLQTCSVGLQLCAALRVAHSNNIVHRDLKPENILLRTPLSEAEPYTSSLEILVADFGIAKVSNVSRENDGQHANLLQSAGFVGTPMYASPEQLMGKSATAASDIYSLVSVLLFCVTGKPLLHFGISIQELSPEDIWEIYDRRLPPSLPEWFGVKTMPQPTVSQRELFQTILSEAMRVDPRTRCSLQRLEQLLENLHERCRVEPQGAAEEEESVSERSPKRPPQTQDDQHSDAETEPAPAYELVDSNIFEDETKPISVAEQKKLATALLEERDDATQPEAGSEDESSEMIHQIKPLDQPELVVPESREPILNASSASPTPIITAPETQEKLLTNHRLGSLWKPVLAFVLGVVMGWII